MNNNKEKHPKGKEIEIEFLDSKEKVSKDDRKKINRLENKIIKQHKEIEELKKKVENYKDDYLRQMAEKENLRKRLEKEKTNHYHFALEEILKEFLIIMDNFERALNNGKNAQDAAGFHKGIEMIYKQLSDIIFRQGVTPIEIKKGKFDPHLHQALLTEETDKVDEMQVVEELQKGYKLHDRLLRPSLVKVAVPRKKN
ncbi:MAG: nucleotide exchange factor GrpE [Candidatus Aminicenantes bacterium]|nr:nucleotide exchange factor GrpE [Candidatus Aminicenantes bacterium]